MVGIGGQSVTPIDVTSVSNGIQYSVCETSGCPPYAARPCIAATADGQCFAQGYTTPPLDFDILCPCRRIRGKCRTRLRYEKWVNEGDNWLHDDVPKLADFERRQFPDQYAR